jgi:hypothetical protein
MDGAVWGFIGVIVGGIITGLVTLGVELISANKASALDSAKRQDDRRLGRDNFQRETLLDLQGAIHELMTLLGHLVTHSAPVTHELNQQALKVGTLGSRVDDEIVRQATEELLEKVAAAMQPGGSETELAFEEATTIAVAAVDRSGELIRATFVDPSDRPAILSYPPKQDT